MWTNSKKSQKFINEIGILRRDIIPRIFRDIATFKCFKLKIVITNYQFENVWPDNIGKNNYLYNKIVAT